MPYEIGFSQWRHSEVSTVAKATASEAYKLVQGLEASDEVIRFIRDHAGREIGRGELQMLSEQERAP